jgi:hypothetical protein
MGFRARFIPRHPEKYEGDRDNIWARSSWEVTVMKWLDSRDAVKRWGSEEINISYISPLDNRVHQYYPDFFVEYEGANGEVLREIVEVKPRHEADADYAKNDRSKTALAVNEAKWRSAAIWCESRGMTFRVITEHSIYHQGPEKKRKRKSRGEAKPRAEKS